MSVIEDLQEKIDTYLGNQSDDIQNMFEDDIESVKNQIDYKIYLAKKLIDKNLEIEDETINFKYVSDAEYTLSVNANIKLSYKNKPFFLIDIESFDLNQFGKEFEYEDREIDEETMYYYYSTLLLALEQNWNDLNNTHKLWVFIPECEFREGNLISFIQFVLLINGKVFHSPIEITDRQLLNDEIKHLLACNTKNFNQYQESAYILSEYNHTKDILLKYLLLYHIIENFMYRRPIAEMANTRFTIRDFKRLYKSIDKDEIGTLLVFFKKISDEQLFVDMTIEPYVDSKLNDLRDLGLLDIKDFVSVLAFDFSNLKYSAGNNNPDKDFRKFIYQIRNSIVHNKETEFHLTHNSFQEFPELKKLFESFLLPTLENIIYYLIFKNSSIVDYPKNHLLLYGEHCET